MIQIDLFTGEEDLTHGQLIARHVAEFAPEVPRCAGCGCPVPICARYQRRRQERVGLRCPDRLR